MLCVAGGGVALLYASKALDAVKEKLENFDQTVGVQILQTALRVPLKTIADNAGRISLSKARFLALPLFHLEFKTVWVFQFGDPGNIAVAAVRDSDKMLGLGFLTFLCFQWSRLV